MSNISGTIRHKIFKFFTFFPNFKFGVNSEVKRAKNGPKGLKIMSVACYMSQEADKYDCDFWYTFVK